MKDPVMDIADLIRSAEMAGLPCEVSFSSSGGSLWIGPRYPQDAGYPHARFTTLSELRQHITDKIERHVRALEEQAMRATAQAVAARAATAARRTK